MASRPDGGGTGSGPAERVTTFGLERGFAVTVGTVLIVLGLAGSLGNPIVGRPGDAALLATGPAHDIVHLVAGALYLHAGVVLSGRQRANSLLVLGAFFAVTGILSLVSADLFGSYGAAANGLDQLAHLGLGVASIVVGWMGRGARATDVRRRGPRVSRPSRS